MRKLKKSTKESLLVWVILLIALVISVILITSVNSPKPESKRMPINHFEIALKKHNNALKVEDDKRKKELITYHQLEREKKMRALVERRKKAEEIEKRRLARIEREKKAEQVRLANTEKQRQAVKGQVASSSGNVGVSRSSGYKGQWRTFQASYYTSSCPSCSGISKSGVDLRQSIYYQGMRVIATDPRVIPLWSIVEIQTSYGTFKAIALDTGGKIKRDKTDILVASNEEAFRLGRHNVQIRMLRRGK